MKLLDLFCGAGGAAMGYHRAGFEIVGVDIKPQKHYPFEFHQADAMTYPLEGFDVIHASPPCQAYSAGSRMRNGYAKEHPRLIEPIRERLKATGLPYIIENVADAPLIGPLFLCGSIFGLAVRRHRGFETNVAMLAPQCSHFLQGVVVGVYGDHPEDSVIRKGHPAIRARSIEHAGEAMAIGWMKTWHEIKESIPPAYTEFIGKHLMEYLA
jgi:DNA (cytosine-5)-methyltransferase 1